MRKKQGKRILLFALCPWAFSRAAVETPQEAGAVAALAPGCLQAPGTAALVPGEAGGLQTRAGCVCCRQGSPPALGRAPGAQLQQRVWPELPVPWQGLWAKAAQPGSAGAERLPWPGGGGPRAGRGSPAALAGPGKERRRGRGWLHDCFIARAGKQPLEKDTAGRGPSSVRASGELFLQASGRRWLWQRRSSVQWDAAGAALVVTGRSKEEERRDGEQGRRGVGGG